MKRFEDYNPIAVFLYFAAMTVPVMFCMDPVLLVISLTGALGLYLTLSDTPGIRAVLWMFALPFIGLIINPLFNHNGQTRLFFINDSVITLEAALYGAVMGLTVAVIMLWFRSFSLIMTSDRLLYIFGAVSPKLALILSMTLRYIPLYRRQLTKVRQTQRAMGLYRDDALVDKLRGSMRIFSVMVTWALENGVVTADSMTARGYATGPRSRYSIFRWRTADVVLSAAAAVMAAAVSAAIALSAIGYTWYPAVSGPVRSAAGIAGYLLYGVMAVLPAGLNIKEEYLWKSLQSKI